MLVKWMGYSDLTWEPRENIPDWIVEFYSISTNLRQNLPKPYIKHVKEVGKGQKYYLLSWEGRKGQEEWIDQDMLSMYYCKTTEGDLLSCNTVKDRDKRLLRHTCGLLISVYPCARCSNLTVGFNLLVMARYSQGTTIIPIRFNIDGLKNQNHLGT